MSPSPALKQKVCLVALPSGLDSELMAILDELAVDVGSADQAALAFCAAGDLEAVRKKHPGLPVIVVSQHSNITEWLDALDGGAADYCSSPFELAHMGWILSSHQKTWARAAA